MCWPCIVNIFYFFFPDSLKTIDVLLLRTFFIEKENQNALVVIIILYGDGNVDMMMMWILTMINYCKEKEYSTNYTTLTHKKNTLYYG